MTVRIEMSRSIWSNYHIVEDIVKIYESNNAIVFIRNTKEEVYRIDKNNIRNLDVKPQSIRPFIDGLDLYTTIIY